MTMYDDVVEAEDNLNNFSWDSFIERDLFPK